MVGNTLVMRRENQSEPSFAPAGMSQPSGVSTAPTTCTLHWDAALKGSAA